MFLQRLRYFSPVSLVIFLCLTMAPNSKVDAAASKSIQLNFVGTQMASYVHRPLLNAYAGSRTDFVTIHEFSNVVSGLPYEELSYGLPSISPRFSVIEDDWPAFLADTAPKKDTMVPPMFVSLPLFLYELSVVYNIEGTDPMDLILSQSVLQLTQLQLIKIFTGQIAYWTDLNLPVAFGGGLNNAQLTFIASQNPKIKLVVIDRASGYTKMLKDTMNGFTNNDVTSSKANQALASLNDCSTTKDGSMDKNFFSYTYANCAPKLFPIGVPMPCTPVNPPIPKAPLCGAVWDDNTAPSRVASPDAVLGYVLNTRWSMGYTSLTNIMQANRDVGIAAIQNNAGKYIRSTTSTLRDTVPLTGSINQDGSGLLNIALPNAYPMVGLSFFVMRSYSITAANNIAVRSYHAVNCTLAVELLRYYRWIIRDLNANGRLTQFGTASIPNATYNDLCDNTLKTAILCTNDSSSLTPKTAALVWTVMLQTIADEIPIDYGLIVGLYIFFPLILLTLIGVFIVRPIYMWYALMEKVNTGRFRIRAKDIVFIETSTERYKAMLRTRPYLDGRLDCPFVTGEFGAGVVLLRPFEMQFNKAPLPVRQELIHLTEWKTHKNLAKFLGVTELFRSSFIVSELSLLGDLRTLLSNHTVRITTPVRYCMAKGVAAGLNYLHRHNIVHGNLRSPSIYVESDWSIRISDWEYVHLLAMQGMFVSKDQCFKQMRKAPTELQVIFLTPLLWTAPETLKSALEQTRFRPTKQADAYSYGIIFYEILTRLLPYKYDPNTGVSPLSLIMRTLSVRNPQRPFDYTTKEELDLVPDSMQRLMKSLWHVNPKRRATLGGICVILKKVEAETKRMADLTIVSTDFFIEKQKVQIKNCNSDLKQRVLDLRRASEDFLTPRVHERVRSKLPAGPVTSKKAYVLHLTMVDYEDLLDATHGESAVALVERFQTLINQHLASIKDLNVFRLHTAGDDCTIVVGIPDGGLKYASDVAVLAFDLLALAWKAVMLDIDTDHIKVRMGIHCGPLIGGIYGNDHKEFTVFGETRDIAEDMERLSDTYRILVSQDFINDLQKFNGYTYILNTDRLRFHDKVTTYWLLGRAKYAEQAALNEINDDFGHITDGRIPLRPEGRKKTPLGGMAMVSASERAQARKNSLATHRATQDQKRPSMLERRQVPTEERRKRSSVQDQDKLKEAHESMMGSGLEEDATFRMVKLGNNEDLMVVNFDDEKNDPSAGPSPGHKDSLELLEPRKKSSRKIKTRKTLSKKSTGVTTLIDEEQVPLLSGGKSAAVDSPAPEPYGDPSVEQQSFVTHVAEEPDPSQKMLPPPQDIPIVTVLSNSDSFDSRTTVVHPLLPAAEPSTTIAATDPSQLPHSHEFLRLRRRKKRTPHRESLHSHAETENPVEHLMPLLPAVSAMSAESMAVGASASNWLKVPEQPRGPQYPHASDASMTHRDFLPTVIDEQLAGSGLEPPMDLSFVQDSLERRRLTGVPLDLSLVQDSGERRRQTDLPVDLSFVQDSLDRRRLTEPPMDLTLVQDSLDAPEPPASVSTMLSATASAADPSQQHRHHSHHHHSHLSHSHHSHHHHHQQRDPSF